MQEIEYARVVRKGGTTLSSATSLVAQVGARGSILDLGVAPRIEAGLRFDHRALSWELRLAVAQSRHENRNLQTNSREISAAVAIFRVFDLDAIALSVGLEGGAMWLRQGYENSPQTASRNSAALFLAPSSQLQWFMSGRYYARLELSAMTYFLRAENAAKAEVVQTPVAWKAGLGIGRFF